MTSLEQEWVHLIKMYIRAFNKNVGSGSSKSVNASFVAFIVAG